MVITTSRVIPGSVAAAIGGVVMTPSRTRKMFWPLPSLMNPSGSSAIPSA